MCVLFGDVSKRNPKHWRVDSDLLKINRLRRRPSSLCILFSRVFTAIAWRTGHNYGTERKTRYKRSTLLPCMLTLNTQIKRLCVGFDVLLRNSVVPRHLYVNSQRNYFCVRIYYRINFRIKFLVLVNDLISVQINHLILSTCRNEKAN